MSSPGSGHLAGVEGGILHPPSQQNTLPTLRSAAGGKAARASLGFEGERGGEVHQQHGAHTEERVPAGQPLQMCHETVDPVSPALGLSRLQQEMSLLYLHRL